MNKHELKKSQISSASDLLNSDKRKYTRVKNDCKQSLCIFDKLNASEKCFKSMSLAYGVKYIIRKKEKCFLEESVERRGLIILLPIVEQKLNLLYALKSIKA